MKGDFSRFVYDRSKHYTGVFKQQGRVELDADWNDYVQIQDHLRRTMEQDLMGDSGVPDRSGGFLVRWDDTDKDLTISADGSDSTIPSRIYVDGILCELDGERRYGSDPDNPSNQPDYPKPAPLEPQDGRVDLVYLDVWQRHVTAVEDPDIQEEALGGPDTTTRLQTVWQVKVKQDVWPTLPETCSLPEKWKQELREIGRGKLSTGGHYLGTENRLYRVEIHEGGRLCSENPTSNNNRVQKLDPNGAYSVEWGTSGTGPGQFDAPWGVAVDSSGNVYVADTANNRVQKRLPDGSWQVWDSSGTGAGQFNGPQGVAVDSSGNVYVADTANHRIQKFDFDGNFIITWGTSGTGPGQFNWPAGVAVDSSGNVYVADQLNNRIQKRAPDGTWQVWGTSGTGAGQFNWPAGVAVDTSGNVYVADTYNSRIQKRLSNGTWEVWGISGTEAGKFTGPSDIAVDSSGNVYVADTGNNRLQRRPPEGTWKVAGDTWGAGIGQLNRPMAVAVDSLGNVYITDLGESCATFKWSRDNGAVVFPIDEDSKLAEANRLGVSRLGRDQALALREGDTIEVLGDDAELKGEPGILTRIKPDGIDRARRELSLESEVSVYAQQDHPKVRRWDQTETEARILKDGARKVEEGQWIELEDGVEIYFEPSGSPDIGYRSGDYWVFAVRAATGKVQALSQAPPQGILHHYCPLALVKWSENADGTPTLKNEDIRDCRSQFRFRPLSEQPATTESFFYLGGDGQEAIPGEELLQPLRVGLLKGGKPPDPAEMREIVFSIEEGNGQLRKVANPPVESHDSVTVQVDEDGVAECSWRLDTATQTQRVRAIVEGGSQELIFTANLSLGWHGTNNPFAGTKIDGPVVFGRNGGALGSTHGDQELALRWDALRNVRIGIAPTHPPSFLTKWGGLGSSEGKFIGPAGVAVDGQGDVYVCDPGNYRVQKFDSDGTFIRTWGEEGTADGEFRSGPTGVAVDGQGDVYVADSGNHRIQKFDSDGTFITKWGSQGTADGEFSWPGGVAIDEQSNVYVADSGNNRIQKFDSDGTFITKWGSQGMADGEFSNGPGGVAVDSSGIIYVADPYNPRIQKFDSDGTFITKWGSQGMADGQLNGPAGVAIDGQGDVYVVDTWAYRVQKFDSNGTFLAKWGSQGTADGQFAMPVGVAVDGQGDVYVADSGNPRIQKFVKTSGNLSTEGNLLAHGGSVDIGGQHSQQSQLQIEGQDVMVRLREHATNSWAGGLWRIRLDSGTLSFESNTAAQGDFSYRKVALQLKSDGTISFPGQKVGYVVDYFISRAGHTVEQGDVVIAATDASHYHGMDDSIPLPEATVTENAYDSRVCGVIAEVVTENNLPYVEVRAPDADHVAGEVRATDAAERRAEELGIRLSDIVGTGSGGRILVADVEAAMEDGSRGVELEPRVNPLARFAGEITPESDATKVEDQQMGTMVTLGSYAHCKVDADIAPISVGDLLTTSPTKGHAQKVLERDKAVGAIVGKALASLDRGRDKIPVLVMLQ